MLRSNKVQAGDGLGSTAVATKQSLWILHDPKETRETVNLAAIPDLFTVRVIEAQALQSEGTRPVAWSSLQAEFVEQTPGRDASGEASTKHGIEAVRLDAFALPGSPLDDTM